MRLCPASISRLSRCVLALQVFWFSSFGEQKLSFPVGHWGIAKPTHTNIHILWEESYNALFEVGYEVILSVCDGASENRKFIQRKVKRSSGSLSDIGIDMKDHFISALTGEPVFFMTCQTHLLKKLRNNLYRRCASLPLLLAILA